MYPELRDFYTHAHTDGDVNSAMQSELVKSEIRNDVGNIFLILFGSLNLLGSPKNV